MNTSQRSMKNKRGPPCKLPSLVPSKAFKSKSTFQKKKEKQNNKIINSYKKGMKESSIGRYPNAVKYFKKAADLGYSNAQYELARLLLRSVDMEPDLALKQAMGYFKLAADQGHRKVKQWIIEKTRLYHSS